MPLNDPFSEIISAGINDSATATAINTLKAKLLTYKTTNAAWSAAQSLSYVVEKLRSLGA